LGLRSWDRRFRLSVLILSSVAAYAQDPHTLRSPDGNVAFRLFVDQPRNGELPRIAYQLSYRNKPMTETSYLSFDIVDQEPLLGENAGQTSWSSGPNTMTVEFMQNGSIGRRINVEVRTWNDGAAFRFVIPRTTPLRELPINDELTEFALATKITEPVTLPFAQEIPGAGWVAIGEQRSGDYPPVSLEKSEENILITHIAQRWDTVTPLTSPWRVIGLGATRAAALHNLRNSGQ